MDRDSSLGIFFIKERKQPFFMRNLDKITKGNEIIFDAQLISSSFFGLNEGQKLSVLKQCQIMKIIQLIENETGIQIQQSNNTENNQMEYKQFVHSFLLLFHLN